MSDSSSNALRLADWVRATLSDRRGSLTHLKLQKLVFYCYGAALAFNSDREIGDDIIFEAWNHGPVNRELWHVYHDTKANPIPLLDSSEAPSYSQETAAHLRDIVTVYGIMDAWELRQESCLEQPWTKARERRILRIPNEEIRAHFEKKYRGRSVCYPEYLLCGSSFKLDRIPIRGRPSLRDLADTIANTIQHGGRSWTVPFSNTTYRSPVQ